MSSATLKCEESLKVRVTKTFARKLVTSTSGLTAAEEVRWHNEATEPAQDCNFSMEKEMKIIISMEK